MSYFHEKLWELLPDLYRIRDSHGDLDSLLRVIAPELDELKALIEFIPNQVNVDQAPEKFLPYLASLVGVSQQGLSSTEARRRAIREAVERYRRKATTPAMVRDLDAAGWEGRLHETFRDTLRLNRRAVIGKARVPGRIFSFGAYRIISENQVAGLRDVLRPHHPAGTKSWFWQWLTDSPANATEVVAWLKQDIRRVAFLDLNETFQLNRNPLNADRHLTRKKTFWEVAHVTQNSTISHQVTDAGICESHWHARSRVFTTNRDGLNGGRRLPNLWISERHVSRCCPVMQSEAANQDATVQRLLQQPLNRTRLNVVPPDCRLLFKQKDFLSVSEVPGVRPSGTTQHQTFLNRAHASPAFKLGSRLNSDVSLQRSGSNGTRFTTLIAETAHGHVRAASHRIDRWQARRPGYQLNRRPLNHSILTDAHVTSARAAFTSCIDVGVGRGGRVKPTRLNQHRLNRHGLRLTSKRTNPLRLGHMPLNQSGLRAIRASELWHERQVDLSSSQESLVISATNIFSATIWPQGGQHDTSPVFG